jgi:rhodanese-related sulfurtransferase
MEGAAFILSVEKFSAIEGWLCVSYLKGNGLPAELDPKLLVVHCKGGYRRSIATSILRRANLTGGYDAWKAMVPGA